ncbi:MAG TPA: alpha/beta hydrolase [Planctomycetota bacterium]|nr:alpha/beta hydrolase [Planctomycetota bacterium]
MPETIRANGLDFACLTAGQADGPLVLLLHGFPDTAHTWTETMSVLAAEGYRTVAPFMRGYHPTPIPPDGDFTTRALGADALGLIDALGRKTAIVVGHDWGAYSAYTAANTSPERVSKLVTVAIPHPRTLRFGNASLRRLYRLRHFLFLRLPGTAARLRRDGFAAIDRIYRRWSPVWDFPPSELESVKACFSVPGALESALAYYRALSVVRPDRTAFRRTSVPTLLLYGLDDGAADPPIFEESPAHFTTPPRLLAVPRAGHFLHREQPALFTRALVEFLRDSPAG